MNKGKKTQFHRSDPAVACPLGNPNNPSPLSVAIRQTLRATTRKQIAPLMVLSLVGLATPALAQHAVVELSSLDGSSGFVLNGVDAFDYSGGSVSIAGDVNGDGVDDLLIGAFRTDRNGDYSGASYVVFGASGVGSNGTLELSTLDGGNGFVLNGVAAYDRSSFSVSAAGDVNGDGIDDLLIGAYGADPNDYYSGTSYVVFGVSGVGSSGTLELSTLDGNNGFVLNGVNAFDDSGISVSAAGDVNGDSVDDVLIGASGADSNGSDSGASYVVFGASGIGSSGTLELSSLDGSNGFVLNGVDAFDQSGISVSNAGDVNGDGVDDLLIGAATAGSGVRYSYGASYVVFGASGLGGSGTVELSALDGNNGFVLNGVNPFAQSGRSVSAAGDVNSDGIDDLLIGAFRIYTNDISSSVSYVVFGASEVGNSGTLELSSLDGSNGFVVNGPTRFDYSSISVSAAGDVNGDGVDDLMIGAVGDSFGLDYGSGASYVVFGARGVGSSGQLELSSLDGNNGIVFNGMATDDRSGRSVSGAGDVNGDGVDDLLIGSNRADTNGNNFGASYVVFGAVVEPNPIDVDANGHVDALTDGLLIIRYLFGIRGSALIEGSVANDCSRCTVLEIEPFLQGLVVPSLIDIDGNGTVDTLTDGLLIIRYLFGIRGSALIEGSVSTDCSRCSELDIETFLQGLVP